MALSWLLTKIRFVKNAGLSGRVIIALFVCKVVAGLVAGWLTYTEPDSDSWHYHYAGLEEHHLLFTNPREYFTNLFYTGYSHGYEGMLQVQNSYWNDLRDNLVIKLVSVLHIFSSGNYYVNVVLYNFIFFFGHIGLYRVFKEVYKVNSLLTAAVVFLLPSVLFYSSTLHKDGIVLALSGVVIFNMWQMLQANKMVAKRLAFITLSLATIFFFRNFVAMAFVPASFAWWLSQLKKLSPVKTFCIVYIVTGILFFATPYISPSVNLPAYMVRRQADFLSIPKGNTTIQMDSLNTSPLSFAALAPKALQHSLLRPFITDMSLSKKLLPLALELIFYEGLALFFLFFRRKDFSFNQPFLLFGLFFGLSLCLIIGYIVPVIGAIVRYRSIYIPFILAPFVLGTAWGKMATFAKIKK